MRRLLFVTGLVVACMVPLVAFGGPSLEITKPPIGPNPSWTGPAIDPHAVQGQWFYDLSSGAEDARPYEFHDNVDPLYGGGWASHTAITGVAQNIQWAGAPGTSNLMAFDVLATITNDTPSLSGWLSGTNSHGEYILYTQEQYAGTLLDTKLTIEFAVSDLANVPAAWTAPHREGGLPFIVAENEEQLAWYCWTPDNGEPGLAPDGGYFVPTWDFGNIAPGQSVQRLLQFTVDGVGLDPADPRWHALVDSAELGLDLLANRTTSLKISTWLDNVALDPGTPWPEDPWRGSNCSVFHNIPEPRALIIAALGLLALWRRRK